MPSLLSRLVPLFLRVSAANRIYTTVAAAERRVDQRRRNPTTAAPPRRMLRQFAVTDDRSQGWPIYSISALGESSRRAVVYLHGGAWVNEIARQHWQLIGEIAAGGTTVIVPIYPLVPFGTAGQVVDAAVDMVLAARDAHDSVSIAGDSAGGQIALSAALLLRDRHHVILNSTVLIAPALDLAMRNPEMDTVQPSDPWLAKPGTRVFIDAWRAELALDDPRVSPIEGDLRGLGPLLLFSGTRDILNPDARLLVERARAADVDIEYHEGAGLVHVYPLTPTPEGRAARRVIVQRLST